MAIILTCVCGGTLGVDDALAGKKARCPACARVVDVPAVSDVPMARVLEAPAGPDAPPDADRLLGHETHLRAIAFWHLVLGVGGGLLLLWPLAESIWPERRTGWEGIAILVCIMGEVLAGLVALFGWGLLRYHAWARWGIVVAALAWLGLVVGNWPGISRPGEVAMGAVTGVWCCSVLFALLHPMAGRVCSRAHRDWVARRGRVSVRFWQSPFLYAPAALVAGAAGLSLGMGWSF